MDVILALADTATFADFHRDRARHDVTRGKILGRRSITLHEALAFGIGEITAFAARAFGDEHARAIDAGRMELHELHILQRQAGAQHHRIAVTGAGVGRGAGEIGAAISAGRQNGLLGAEAMQRPVFHRDGDNATAGTFLVHDQINGEVFDEEFSRIAQGLAIERMQHRVAGAVGGSAGALGNALAVIGRHATERALVDLAVFGA